MLAGKVILIVVMWYGCTGISQNQYMMDNMSQCQELADIYNKMDKLRWPNVKTECVEMK
jgi:hypothetical protein